MEVIPHTGLLPFMQATPTGHPASTAKFSWQISPTDSGFQYEQNPAESIPVRNTWTTSVWLWQLRRNEWGDALPEFRGQDLFGHPITLCIVST